MKKYILTNCFHKTKCCALAPGGVDIIVWLQMERPRVWERVKKELCGIKDCQCGIIRN